MVSRRSESGSKVAATGPGTFTIKVAPGDGSGDSAEATITCPPAKVKEINVSPQTADVEVGQQQTSQATGWDADGNQVPIPDPQWSVSGGGTLMSEGESATFTASQPGEYTITCQDGDSGVQASFPFRVTIQPNLQSIEILSRKLIGVTERLPIHASSLRLMEVHSTPCAGFTSFPG